MHYQELSSAKYMQEDTSVSVASWEAIPDAKKWGKPGHARWLMRWLILPAIFILISLAWFFLLPFLQAPLLLQAPGGVEGPWLIRPEPVGRYVGCLLLGAITLWLISIPQRRKWRADDQRIGRLRFADLPFIFKLAAWFAGLRYLLVWGIALALYLFTSCVISADGIQVRVLNGTVNYSFAQVTNLGLREHLHPANENDKYGYEIQFGDGRKWYFDSKTEGLTEPELTAITNFLSKQTGQEWGIIPEGRRW